MLEEIAKEKRLEDLNSEDILKLFYVPYLKSEIMEAFKVSDYTLEKIKKEKGIENIYYANINRNIITILYYCQEEFSSLNDYSKQAFIDALIIALTFGVLKRDYLKEKLESIDWLRLNILKEIKDKNIDIKYRENEIYYYIYTIKKVFKDKESSSSDFKDYILYNFLENLKSAKINLKKEELTYAMMYELSVNERISDEMGGSLVGLKKYAYRRFREKNGIKYPFYKNIFSNLEILYGEDNEYKDILSKYDSFELLEGLYDASLKKAKTKNLNLDVIKDIYEENLAKLKAKKTLDEIAKMEEVTYDVVVSNKKHIASKKKTNKKINGKSINQEKANKSKIESGKLGEKIVLDFEKKKLKDLGYENPNEYIDWVSKPDKDGKTKDGLGYDIVSINDKGEKIYIEVKTSLTNKSNNIDFNISLKEVELMEGKLKNIDESHAFIYYVSNIKKDLLIAELLIIDSKMFQEFTLNSIMYEVNEIFEKEK